MKISEERLKEIIKEEIDTAVEEGLFDRIKSLGSRAGSKVAGAFGADTASREMAAKADSLKAKDAAEKAAKKRRKTLTRQRKTQTYPATELTALLSMIQKASRQSGVKFKGKRGALVDEFEKILYSGGFRLDEQRNRLFIGKDGNIAINPADAPVLTNFLTTLKAESPDVFKQLAKQMNNYRFDLPDNLDSEASEEVPSDTTAADPDPDASDSEADVELPADATPAAPPASSAGGGDVMPISGTEFMTMQYIAKQNKTDILKAIRAGAANIGAAAKDPQSQQLVKNFNREFFPALVKMTKNPNIDIAEGVDLDMFLEELLSEQSTPLTKRQQAQKKGQARKRLGAGAYFKSVGGKPPLIARQIAKSLEAALLKNVDAQADGVLYDAAAEAAEQIKDPKQKKQYEDTYLKMLEKDPNKRLKIYKENVAAFIQAVIKIATEAAAAVAPKTAQRPLPESINESKRIERWKVLSGIK